MAIKTTCPNPKCKQKVSCPDEMAGREVKCPTCGNPVQIPKEETRPPDKTKRLGKYTLVGKIGEGGMGAVYEAVQDGLGRRVALKVLPKRMTKNPQQLERFRREAHAAAVLNHPNIVMVYELDEDQGFHFFSMEYVEGDSLQDRIKNSGKLPIKEALSIVRKIADALNYAWDRNNVIHRDIKPANILISKEGHVKLADLGLAKSTEEDSSLTRDNTAMGTPSYMAPEQGRAAKAVDCRADIYALGITLFRLVTGAVPYTGDTALAVMMAHVEEELPDARELNREISDDLWAVIQHMSAKDAEDRYQTHAELIGDLDALEAGREPPLASGTVVPKPREDDEDPEAAELTIAAERTDQAPSTTDDEATVPARTKQSILLGVGMALICVTAVILAVSRIRRTAEEISQRAAANASEAPDAHPEDGGADETPPGEPIDDTAPTTSPVDVRNTDLARRMGAARDYVKEHPDAYDEAIRKFRAIERAGRGTNYAAMARQERDRLEKERKTALDEAWLKLNSTVASLAAEGKFGEAFRTLSTLEGVPDFAKNAWQNGEVDQLSRSLQRQVKKRVDSIWLKADRLAADGKFDEAREACEEAKRLGLPAVDERIAWKLKEIDRKEQESASIRQEKQEELYQQALAEVLPLLRQRKYPEAIKMLETCARDPGYAGIVDRLQAEQADVGMAQAGFGSLTRAIGAQVGRTIRTERISGKLKGIEDGTLVISSEGATVGTRIADLPTKEILELAAPGMRRFDGMSRVQLAFFYLYDGDLDQARKELERASAAGMDTRKYDHRVLPVLVVRSEPAGGVVGIEMAAESGAPAHLPGGKEEVKRETATTPARVVLYPDRSVTVRVTKEGSRPAVRRLSVATKGEYVVELELEGAGLPKSMRESFEALDTTTDQFGNRVRLGLDPEGQYPYEIRHKQSGINFVLAPAGTFEMGQQLTKFATPVHRVTVSRAFYMGKYEVTVGQFSRFVKSAAFRTRAEKDGFGIVAVGRRLEKRPVNWSSPGYEQTDRHPVVLVTRSDLDAFLKWLNKGEDRPCRLPTEAEWEYACRAGTKSRFYWGFGTQDAAKYANFASPSGPGRRDRTGSRRAGSDQARDDFQHTAPVGSLAPNAWGFYDMLGNVFERCADRFARDYYARSPTHDPQGPEEGGADLVDRGGAWYTAAQMGMCASRYSSAPDFRVNFAGFRVAVSLPE